MNRLTGNLEAIADQMRLALADKDTAREKALPLCREAIRYCSNAIRAVHRHEFDPARQLLKSARNLIDQAEQAVADHNELRYTGFIRDAQKEFAEGSITLALVTGEQIPDPAKLRIEVAAYLNGLGEAVGELRRYLLDNIRRDNLSQGEELLSAMDDIYSILVSMDFPYAITSGLRRTTDVVRGILEKTRSDLTLVMRQKDLETKLKNLGQKDIRTSQQSEIGLDHAEVEIYEALRNWRERKASEDELKPFMVAHNSWLKQIIKLRPSTPDDLIGIKGFGGTRARKYGNEIIEILKALAPKE